MSRRTTSAGLVCALLVVALMVELVLASVSYTPVARASAEMGAATTVLSERAHIFYYPWYGTPATDGQWVHWQQNKAAPPYQIASNFYPKLGPYSSNDPGVVDQHMAWIAQAGAGVVVTSWWGPGSYEDRAVPLLLERAAAHQLKVAFHLEPYPGRTPLTVKRDIAYLYDRYGSLPAFYRVSRPTRYGPAETSRGVLYIYDSLATPDAAWRSLLDSIRLTPLDAFVLASTSDLHSIVDGHFDGLYTYDVLRVDGSIFRNINQAVTHQGGLFAPSVGPGYIDSAAVGNVASKQRSNGEMYQTLWRRAIESGAEWITITSFNEWHEGTQIEPAAARLDDTATDLSYEGAYGLSGNLAELAYLDRTRLMVDLFMGAASGRRAPATRVGRLPS